MDLGSERSVDANELVETEDLEKNGEIDSNSKDNGNYEAEIVDGELLGGQTMSPSNSPSPLPATKGRGLRKWRRIRREAGKETNSSLDSNRKRGMIALPVTTKQRNEGSSSSTNAISHPLDHNLLYGDLVRGSDFASRADSDNSEDRNSTAASDPKPNRNKIHVKPSLNGKNPGVSVQEQEQRDDDQQEKSQSQNQNQTKKARGGVKLKKENSISSMESDSRSSNFIFTQGSNSVTSNGRKNGRLVNYEEEDYSDDAQNGEVQTQTVFNKNEADSEDVSHEEKVNGDHDRLVDPIIPLHLAQEALEREVQKLRDVGKEDTLSSDYSFKSTTIKIEEARVMIELKNAKIFELESILNFNDYEELLIRRISAELEYLVISKTIQSLKLGHMDKLDQIDNLKVQQKKLKVQDDEQVQLWKVKNMACRYGLCFVIQLVLVLVVVYMFVLQFSTETKSRISTARILGAMVARLTPDQKVACSIHTSKPIQTLYRYKT
ncbi:hypothetical protein LXL04_037236 [Taraxacum kok-saghyz]